MRKILPSAILLLCLLLPAPVLANSPRDYLPLDPGSVFIALYYDHYWGNELYSKSKKISGNADYYANIGIFRAVYYTQLGPFTIDPQVIMPFGQAGLMGDESSVLGDTTFAATIWFINNKENGFIFAYTPYLTVPTGQYNPYSLVNLGSNRWSTKHEVCVAKSLGDRAWLEVALNAQFYFDNTNARDARDSRVNLSKDATFGIDSHLSYSFTPAFFGSLDYYYNCGGQTRLDGESQKDWADTHTLGLTFAYMLNAHTQLMVNGKTDIGTPHYGVRASSVGARLGFIF